MAHQIGRALVNWLYRSYCALIIGAAGLVVVLTLFPSVQAGLHSALFVTQVLPTPVKPQTWFTDRPVRQEVTYPRPGGQGVADLYRIPDERKRAAVLIFLGANAAGRDDPDVINLGHALARAGFAVMFHWSPTMGQRNNIDPTEVENLVWAFQYLKSQEFVDPERVGLGGFSVGGSFALVAAADPRIRQDVVFLNSFGAYYDIGDLFLQIASRSSFYQDRVEPWEVDRLTLRVFANELIELVPDPAERELLNHRFLEGPEVPESDLAQLTGTAALARQLLEGTTLPEAERLYQSLPPQFLREMERISPSSHIADLQARLLIMHDEGDRLIPVGESRRLAEALEPRGNYRYTETRLFDHVRPGSSGSPWGLIREASRLFRHLYIVIRVAY